MSSEETREGVCQNCECEYPVWFAPNELWNRVCRNEDGSDIAPFLCLTCFAVLAEKSGFVPLSWALSPVIKQPLKNAAAVDFNSSAASKDGGFLERLG